MREKRGDSSRLQCVPRHYSKRTGNGAGSIEVNAQQAGGCAMSGVSTVDRMSQTAAVEDEETLISNTDLGSSVVAVMQSAQASPRDHPSAPD
jgi:hypothetical protein